MSEIGLSGLERTKRIDSEFFLKQHILNESALENYSTKTINQLAEISDGNHFSISKDFVDEGVPYYRGQDVTGRFFAEQSSPQYINEQAYKHKHMVRSHLKKGDVLLSIVGTVGELSLIDSARPATCSCKLAIFRPHSIAPEILALFLKSLPGSSQIQRYRRGTVQTGFLLEDTDQVFVPQFSKKFSHSLIQKVRSSRSLLEESKSLHQQAEQTLLAALGLEDWEPPNPLTYEVYHRDTLDASRLDAEFFQEKFEALRSRLTAKCKIVLLSKVAEVTKGKTVPYSESGTIPIIRSGDLVDISSSDQFRKADSSEDIFYLQKGDVLISSIGFGSIGKVQVFDLDEPCGTVSEVTVIRPHAVNSYYLCNYLRSIAGQLQFDRWITGATGQLHLYPRDVKKLFVALPNEGLAENMESLAQGIHEMRQHSKALLERAKRAVEIAIERDEETALAYLDGKHYVAEELIPKLFTPTRHYVDLATVQRTIEAEALTYEPSTLKTYLHNWQKEGRLHDAGRGWYSDLSHAFIPSKEAPPLPGVSEHLRKRFPLLEHTLWSTRQLAGFFHHLPSKHATFLMVDREAMEAVSDSLLDADFEVVTHPLGKDAQKFTLRHEDTLIIRPRLASDHTETCAPIEQMLVDLFYENEKLSLIDESEYGRILRGVSESYRLNVAALTRYADRRKMNSNHLLALGGITSS